MADLLLHLPRVRQRRPRSYRHNDSKLAYSDQELRQSGYSIHYKPHRGEFTEENALRFHSGGNSLQVIGDTIGVDKSTVSRAVRNVSSKR